jgi:subtilisin family serine protease
MVGVTLDCNNNGIDDDGNGYVDDCHGIDTINNDSDPMDDNNHGSHVAGTIGAVGNNGVGVVGVNWNVSIMACKFLGADSSGPISDAIQCLEYFKVMKDQGENIVATNNSWLLVDYYGTGPGSFLQSLFDAIEEHRKSGILFIASAGNFGLNSDITPTFPASYYLPNIISVAATHSGDGFVALKSRQKNGSYRRA